MKKVSIDNIEPWYLKNYQDNISGRWITLQQILPLIESLNDDFKVKCIGNTSQKKDIYSVQFGSGETKIIIWTQMHGNESTGTKSVFDLFNFFTNPGDLQKVKDQILNNCSITCIPMLNPDGAEVYSRVNAQGIDLNRDFINRKAMESKILQEIVEKIQPDYCFNMHDQRTIFSVGATSNPATLSFLAPSEDEKRTITNGRMRTMEVINSMASLVQNFIPNQIGRYTDEFYPTATGDNFQKLGYNTILVESGHYKNDYPREITRKFTFFAILQGILFISSNKDNLDYKKYFAIPDNEKNYLDIILKNVNYKGKITDIGILFVEKLKKNKIYFLPSVEKIKDLSSYSANTIIECFKISFKNNDDVKMYLKSKGF